GAYYNWTEDGGHVTQTATLLPGAFGLAPGVNFNEFNQNYRVPVLIDIPGTRQETSLFGSVTLPLGANTELSGGVRHIWSITNSATVINVGNSLLNLAAI